MKIWSFDTTEQAYDACQTDENICRGDVLLIAPERVIGIAGTWPISITEAHGCLHQALEGQIGKYLLENEADHFLPEGMRLASSLGFPLDDELRAQAA